VKPKPTPTPTPTPTPKPTKKPKTTPAPSARISQLRTLAALLRAQDGRGAKVARAAAKDVDDAAVALDEGDDEEAATKFADAKRRLIDAQREHRWQATPQIVVLFNTLSRTMPHSNDNDE
jgi:hypothetical protein